MVGIDGLAVVVDTDGPAGPDRARRLGADQDGGRDGRQGHDCDHRRAGGRRPQAGAPMRTAAISSYGGVQAGRCRCASAWSSHEAQTWSFASSRSNGLRAARPRARRTPRCRPPRRARSPPGQAGGRAGGDRMTCRWASGRVASERVTSTRSPEGGRSFEGDPVLNSARTLLCARRRRLEQQTEGNHAHPGLSWSYLETCDHRGSSRRNASCTTSSAVPRSAAATATIPTSRE